MGPRLPAVSLQELVTGTSKPLASGRREGAASGGRSHYTSGPSSSPRDRPVTATAHWAVLLLRSGRLGAVVGQVRAELQLDRSTGIMVPHLSARITRHTSASHYTTRRKQGGSQSSNDSKGGKARSAGAQLRRHGEEQTAAACARLWEGAWGEALGNCSLWWVQCAPGMTSVLLGGGMGSGGGGGTDAAQAAVARRRDPRFHKVPFPTGRPGSQEATRVLERLIRRNDRVQRNTIHRLREGWAVWGTVGQLRGAWEAALAKGADLRPTISRESSGGDSPAMAGAMGVSEYGDLDLGYAEEEEEEDAGRLPAAVKE